MTLDTQGLFTVEPGMIVVLGALAGMTTRAGHRLSGSRVVDIFTDGMGEYTVFPMTFFADCIDRGLGHGRMVRAVGRMAVVAGICHLMAEFCRFMALESRCMALAADVTFLPFEQPIIIAGVRGMAGHTAVFFVTNQVIMA